MESHLNSRSFGLLAVAVGWALFLMAIGSPEVILFTVPVFMLAAPLALGLYAGEDLIERLARAFAPAKHRPADATAPTPAALVIHVAGTPLIASNLAGRAPPLSFT